jgi:hypothetical protein
MEFYEIWSGKGLFQESRMNEEEHSNLSCVKFPKTKSGESVLFKGWILMEPYLEATNKKIAKATMESRM